MPAPQTPLTAQVEARLAPARARLLAHPIYAAVADQDLLRRFMGEHVFAVWDFMTLLKRLQREFTTCEVLWRPPARPVLARFVNEVVLGEESDLCGEAPQSHLELYLQAMDEAGADASAFRTFLAAITAGAEPISALRECGASAHVQAFTGATLTNALEGSGLAVLASFLYGREDVIPEMFARLLATWEGRACALKLYLERHIELDGDSHGPLARQALESLLDSSGPEGIAEAVAAAEAAIEDRIALWDGCLAALSAVGSQS